MQETYEFLKRCGVFYLATVDGNKPRVRPFGALNIFEGKLYIQTGKSKNVSRQMMANPYIEICGYVDGVMIRVEAKVVADERIEAKQSMLDNNPELKNMYQATDPNTEVLFLIDATATIYSFTEAPKVIEFE